MNNPHESQAAAMARVGELPDGEQLRECINSGQVSAAQVVEHADAGQYRPNSSGVFGAVRVCQISDCECSQGCGNGPCRQEIRDLPKPTGWPTGMLQDDSRGLSKALSRDPNARALVRESVTLLDAARKKATIFTTEEIAAAYPYIRDTMPPLVGYPSLMAIISSLVAEREANAAALAAERAEVARLREALESIVHVHSMHCDHHKNVSRHSYELAQIAEDALTAPGENHE